MIDPYGSSCAPPKILLDSDPRFRPNTIPFEPVASRVTRHEESQSPCAVAKRVMVAVGVPQGWAMADCKYSVFNL